MEKHIERAFCSWAEATYDIIVLKLNLQGTRGWPDRLVVLPHGETVWVEFKDVGKQPRELQKLRHQQLRGLGHVVCVFSDLEEAKTWFVFWADNAGAPRKK